MFSGTIRTRDRVSFGSGLEGKVTAIAVFEQGPAVQRQSVAAGGVAKLWGLADVQIGDRTTAGPRLPEGDGYLAALVNFRFLASAVWTIADAVALLKEGDRCTAPLNRADVTERIAAHERIQRETGA